MIVLGIDPGTATTGYGVVEYASGRAKYLACGIISTGKSDPMPQRLHEIYNQLTQLIELYKPDVIATEQLFFSKNVTTGILVSRTVGIVLLAAAQHSLPWHEYRPAEVKMAVVGYGAAEKRQVQAMVMNLLKLDKPPRPDDAADALAIAICHAHSARG
jgi:crossover junction endodeoxyribonuclease RuvC